MRVFAISSGACPKRIWSVAHYRNDGTCLCDGKPAFTMLPYEIRVLQDGKWVGLNRFLTDLFLTSRNSKAWDVVYASCTGGSWPLDYKGTLDLCCVLSENHKTMMFGVFVPEEVKPSAIYFQGQAVMSWL